MDYSLWAYLFGHVSVKCEFINMGYILHETTFFFTIYFFGPDYWCLPRHSLCLMN